jgi:GSH-dependent disulfide-bond oxidoreductase
MPRRDRRAAQSAPPPYEERKAMIDLYYWTTPNGHRIATFLEEAGLAYRIVPVISKSEQFRREFLARVSPITHSR